uniref:Complexin 3 n=1 Tax=Sinocyclocheilus grahami TaxID=75366 RepID=A0A672KD31_SINGR
MKFLAMHITNQTLKKCIIVTHTMYCWLLLQISPSDSTLLLCCRLTYVIDYSPFPWFSVSQNELDETQIQAAADDVELPTELAKMIAEDNQEEEQKQSVLGHLTNIQNVDMGHLKGKAQATLEDLKNSAEKCCVM